MKRSNEEQVERVMLKFAAMLLCSELKADVIPEANLLPFRDYIGVGGRNGSVAMWIPEVEYSDGRIMPAHFQTMGFSVGGWQFDDVAYGRTGFSPIAVIPHFDDEDIS